MNPPEALNIYFYKRKIYAIFSDLHPKCDAVHQRGDHAEVTCVSLHPLDNGQRYHILLFIF